MFVILNKIVCSEGGRGRVASIMASAAEQLEECTFYAISLDGIDQQTLWIYEVWSSEAAHAASLDLPPVVEAIQSAVADLVAAERIFEGTSLRVARNALITN